MRVPVNLASEPFRRDRAAIAGYSICIAALVALLGLQAFLIVSERVRLRDTRAEVDRLTKTLAGIQAERSKSEAVLREPSNAQVLDRSLLLNTLLERKSIAWTKIYSDLGTVLPFNVKLIQVRLPQIDSRNRVSLDMIVGAQEPAAVIDFLKRLQESPLFGPMTLHSTQPPTQNEPLYRYRVSVNYAQKL